MLDHHYDGLEGDWAEYADVAQKFVKARFASIPREDIEDLVQRIILAMAEVGRKMGREPGGWLWATARYELYHYWRERAQWPLLSLNQKYDHDPDGRELWETLAAPYTDQDAQLDARKWLEDCGPRILGIAQKMMMSQSLTAADRAYLRYWRQRMGIPTPRSGRRMSSSRAHEVHITPYRVTVYKAICAVLGRSPTPLHEKEIRRLVAEEYPPLAQRIKSNFPRQVAGEPPGKETVGHPDLHRRPVIEAQDGMEGSSSGMTQGLGRALARVDSRTKAPLPQAVTHKWPTHLPKIPAVAKTQSWGT